MNPIIKIDAVEASKPGNHLSYINGFGATIVEKFIFFISDQVGIGLTRDRLL
jgi:hypothetical protein